MYFQIIKFIFEILINNDLKIKHAIKIFVKKFFTLQIVQILVLMDVEKIIYDAHKIKVFELNKIFENLIKIVKVIDEYKINVIYLLNEDYLH